MRVLIIEDDAETAAYVLDGLRRHGHVADQVSDGRDGLMTAAGGDYDAIVVDRMLPGLDGLAIVKMIRGAGVKAAVLFLTARGGIDDRVEGLEAGGDDYLTKPFAFSELLARLNALARRPPLTSIETVLRVADLEMDLIARRVKRNGTDVELQPREFKLLEYLMRNAGRVVTRTMLLERVWEFHFNPKTKLSKPTSAGSAPRSAQGANNSSFTQFGEWDMSFGLPLRLMRTASFGLALLYATLLAASAVVLGFIVYWTVQASIDRQMAAHIDAEIEILKEELRSEGAADLAREVETRINYFGALDYFLADADGKRLAGNLSNLPATDGWSDIAIPDPQRGKDPKYFRVKIVHLDNGYRLVVGDDLGSKEDIRRAFLGALGWALLAFLVLTLTAGALLSSAFLSRVDAIARTAEAISNGDLGSRVPLQGTNDNFDRLSATLNRMLDQIQRLMESLSQVSNDIAHALRTPLGRLRQKLEVARANSGANSECTKTIDAALEETDNILDTFSALVRIAQIESGTRTAGFREIDLSKLFETVSEAFSAAGEDEGKTLTAKIAPSIKFWGDGDLISEMLANLLDNAIRHTAQGAHIEVSLVNHGSQLVASVADDGPGVPPSEQERIFRRFYRLERSIGTAGTGLGLSLVAAVAELHGMKFCATDNKPGLRMTLSFDCGVLNAKRASRAIDHDLAQGPRQIARRGPERAEKVALQS